MITRIMLRTIEEIEVVQDMVARVIKGTVYLTKIGTGVGISTDDDFPQHALKIIMYLCSCLKGI